jgi:hypothetical protein
MKKNVTVICTAASLILIFDSIGMGYKIMAFLFAGIIPGTNIALTPIEMLILMTVLASAVIAQTGVVPMLRKYKLTEIKKTKLIARRLSRV